MVPAFVFGGRLDATPLPPTSDSSDRTGYGDDPGRVGGDPPHRTLDLRRTAAPDAGVLSTRREPHPRRYSVRTFDEKGRLGDRPLFSMLGWHPRMSVAIRVHGSGALVVSDDPFGGFALTDRAMVPVPAAVLRWCGFGRGEQVLLAAVPSLSSLVVHGLEEVDRALPDSECLVVEVHSADRASGSFRVPSRGSSGAVDRFDADGGSAVDDDRGRRDRG